MSWLRAVLGLVLIGAFTLAGMPPGEAQSRRLPSERAYRRIAVETPLSSLSFTPKSPLTRSEVVERVPHAATAQISAVGSELLLRFPTAKEAIYDLDRQTGRPMGAPTVHPVSARSGSRDRRSLQASGTHHGIHCDKYYVFYDALGRFTVQRACGLRAAPWSFRWSPTVGRMMAGGIIKSEAGLDWTKNGNPQPRCAPHHDVQWNYLFHGTFRGPNGVGLGSHVSYWDRFYWAPYQEWDPYGGNIVGHLVFKGPLA